MAATLYLNVRCIDSMRKAYTSLRRSSHSVLVVANTPISCPQNRPFAASISDFYPNRLLQPLCINVFYPISNPKLQISPMSRSTGTTAISRATGISDSCSLPDVISPPVYKHPASGLLSRLPLAVVPYAELMRLDKPTGTYYLYLPCLFSTLLASLVTSHVPPPTSLLALNAFLFFGSGLFRSAGCTWDDILDRDLDPKMTRTRLRPLARGAVGVQQAYAWLAAQTITGAGIVMAALPPACILYALPSVAVTAVYPLAKRVTHYPQVVLGFAMSWGIIISFPAMSIDLFGNPTALAAAGTLYSANIIWTVLYDTIYAHQDAKDDIKVGIKSIAVKHGAKTLLSGLAATQVALLLVTGWIVGAGPIYFIGTCGGAMTALATMIWRVRLDRPADCGWWFKWGCWFTGGSIASGFLGEYWLRWNKEGGGERGDQIVSDAETNPYQGRLDC